MKKKEAIYVALAFFTSIGQLTWVQMTYNDPSFALAWTGKQLAIILAISAVFVVTQTLIAWKAYLSDPNPRQTNETTQNPTPVAPANGSTPASGSN